MISSSLALVFLALSMLAPPKTATGRSAVLVLADGQVRTLTAGESASAGDLAALDHAWVWSADHAPRRLEAEAFARWEPPRAADRRLAVRVARRETGAETGLQVLSAPAEMWEEIPEDLLPAWPAPKRGTLSLPIDGRRPWRLRAIGPTNGTWWLDLPPGQSAVVLAPVAAADIAFTVVGERREALAGARVSATEGHPERGGLAKLADFGGDRSGRVVLPMLPASAALTLVVAAPGHAPATVQGYPGRLPPVISLAMGATVRGRFTDRDGKPLAGVEVAVRTYASDRLPLPIVQEARTNAKGEFQVAELPRRKAVLTARASGRAPLTRTIAVDGESVDLGTLPLAPSFPVLVEARDDRGEPVAGAKLAADRGPAITTDALGRARLDVDRGEPFDLVASAPGHVESKGRRYPPFASPLRVALPRSFLVRGTFLDAARAPVGDGTVRLRAGGTTEDRPLPPDGQLELDLRGGVPAMLTLLSPHTCALEVKVAAGAAGEVRDLGNLVAPPGLTVAGRLVSAATGEPLAGAKVWAPRPSELGTLMAWVLRDLVETRSREDGAFELSGLPALPATLRIEEPGMAVKRIPIVPEPSSGRLDLGDVALAGGATVTVSVDSDVTNGIAQVDLGGQSLPLDELTAPVENGRASIDQVPAGRYTVSVLDGSDIVCESSVTVPPDRTEVEAPCRRKTVDVSGAVEVGRAAASAGILLWIRQAETAIPGGIVTFSLGGVDQQHVFSPGRSQVDVGVGDDGHFRTRKLRPGTWQVVWMPEGGSAAEPKSIEIPAQEKLELTLSYPGASLSGTVVDREGRPVAGARVEELRGRASTVTQPDGSFTLSGFASGSRLLQAHLQSASSAVTEVEIEADRDPAPVRLTLDDHDHDRLAVTVVDGEGRGVAGALLFVEVEGQGQGLRILTADGSGRAETAIQPPYPPRLRAAAAARGAWAFGGWQTWDRAQAEGLGVVFGPSGELIVTSREASGSPGIATADGWNVGALIAWLGSRATLAPSSPLVLPGLPAGVYTVTLGEKQLEVEVGAGKPAEAKLD